MTNETIDLETVLQINEFIQGPQRIENNGDFPPGADQYSTPELPQGAEEVDNLNIFDSESRVKVHEIQIDNQHIFVIDGDVARENGLSQIDINAQASLAIQDRITILQDHVNITNSPKVIITGAPGPDAISATFASTNTGVNAVVVNTASMSTADLTASQQAFLALEGVIRPGGQTYTVMEDRGLDGSLGIMSVDVGSGTLSTNTPKDLGINIATDVVKNVLNQLAPVDRDTIQPNYFGPVDAVDLHSDALQVVGGLVDIVRGNFLADLVLGTAKDLTLGYIDNQINKLSLSDFSAIGDQTSLFGKGIQLTSLDQIDNQTSSGNYAVLALAQSVADLNNYRSNMLSFDEAQGGVEPANIKLNEYQSKVDHWEGQIGDGLLITKGHVLGSDEGWEQSKITASDIKNYVREAVGLQVLNQVSDELALEIRESAAYGGEVTVDQIEQRDHLISLIDVQASRLETGKIFLDRDEQNFERLIQAENLKQHMLKDVDLGANTTASIETNLQLIEEKLEQTNAELTRLERRGEDSSAWVKLKETLEQTESFLSDREGFVLARETQSSEATGTQYINNILENLDTQIKSLNDDLNARNFAGPSGSSTEKSIKSKIDDLQSQRNELLQSLNESSASSGTNYDSPLDHNSNAGTTNDTPFLSDLHQTQIMDDTETGPDYPVEPGSDDLILTTHIVVPNDTLSQLAVDNHTTLEELIRLNPQYTDNPDLIIVGDKINIPDKYAFEDAREDRRDDSLTELSNTNGTADYLETDLTSSEQAYGDGEYPEGSDVGSFEGSLDDDDSLTESLTLDTNNPVVGELESYPLSREQLDNIQGFLDSMSTTQNLQSFGAALDSGDRSQIVGTLLNSASSLANQLTQVEGDANISTGTATGIAAAAAAGNLYHAIEGGDDLDIAISTIQLVNLVDNLNNITVIQNGVTTTENDALPDSAVGKITVGLSLIQAFDSGDDVEILLSTLSLIDTFGDSVIENSISSTFAGSADANIPYIAYIRAGIQLLEGDVEGAAMTVATAAMMKAAMSTGNPYIIAAAVIISIIAPGLMASTPKGSLEFTEDGEGNLGYNSDGALAGMLASQGDGYIDYLNQLGAAGFEFELRDLPGLGARENSSNMWFENRYSNGNNVSVRTEFITVEDLSEAGLLDPGISDKAALRQAAQENAQGLVNLIQTNQMMDEIQLSFDAVGIAGGTYLEQFNYVINPQGFGVNEAQLGQIQSTLAAEGIDIKLNAQGVFFDQRGSRIGGGGGKEEAGDYQNQIRDRVQSVLLEHDIITVEDGDGGLGFRAGNNPFLYASSAEIQALSQSLSAQGFNMRITEDGAEFRRTSPYAGATDWGHTIQGTGIFFGGGQAIQAPVYVQAAQISSVPPPRLTPAQALRQVSETWGIRGNLFSGEQGSLLAMGVGTGVVNYAALAETTIPAASPIQSLLANPDVADLLPVESAHQNIIATGYGVLNPLPGIVNPGFVPGEFNTRFSSVYASPLTTGDGDGSNHGENTGGGNNGNSGNGGNDGAGEEDVLDAFNHAPVLLFDRDLLGDVVDDDEENGLTLVDPEDRAVRILSAINTATDTAETATETTTFESAVVIPETDFTMSEDRILFASEAELLKDEAVGTTLLAINSAVNGTAILNASGEVEFTPDADFSGLASFTYTQRSPSGVETTQTVTITVQGVNDAPFAVDDGLIDLVEDTPFNLNTLVANDTDIDGDALNVVGVSQVGHGQVTVAANGDFIYTPEENFVGVVSLVYIVSDPEGRTSLANAQFNYTAGANDAPVVVDDVFNNAIEDTAFQFNTADLLINDSDGDGDALTVTAVELVDPDSAILTFDAVTGNIELTPQLNFNGTIALTYTLTDDDGSGNADAFEETGNVSVQFNNTLDVLSGDDNAFVIDEDAITLFPAQTLFNNVINEDTETTTISAVRMVGGEVGLVDLLPDGSVRFIPGPEFSGNTAFEVRITNGLTGDELQRTDFRVDITVTPQNDAPLAEDDVFTDAVEDNDYTFNAAALTANDIDQEGDAFTLTDLQLTDATLGTLNWDQVTGNVIFTPAADFFGEVPLVYTLTETISGLTSTGNVRIVVANVNDNFTNSHKAFTQNEDEVVVYTPAVLLEAQIDVDGEALIISNVRMNEPAQGTVLLLADGSVRFTPAANLNSDDVGPVTFEIDVTDGHTTRTSSIVLTVESQNDGPSVMDDALIGGSEETVYTLNASDLLANDRDPDGPSHPLSLIDVTLLDGTQGSITFDTVSGRIDITPVENFLGDIAFIYTVVDDLGATEPGQATVSFVGINDTADQSDKAFTLNEDEVRIFTRSALLDNLIDVDGETLQITNPILSDPAAGTLIVLINGDLRFEPAAQFSGDIHFTFEANDGNTVGEPSPVVTVDLTITAENDAPNAVLDNFIDGVEETVYTLNVTDLLANDFDEEGDAFSFTDIQVVNTDAGVLDWDQDTGGLTFTPTVDFFGEARLQYTLRQDDNGNTATGTASLLFANVDDTAAITDKSYRSYRPNSVFNLDEDEVKLFTKSALLETLVDADGETLSITDVNLVDPTLGTVVITADGHVKYTPKADYVGEAAFVIDVTDGHTPTQSTMTVRMWPQNDAPDGVDDSRTLNEEDVLTVTGADLLANDRDVEGDPFSVTGIWATSVGEARYDASTDTLTYTPGSNVFGPAWVDYIVEDDQGAWSVARLDVAITNTDDPVIAEDDVFTFDEDAAQVFSVADLTGNDQNPDQETLSIVAIDNSRITDGTLVLNGAGEVAFTPDTDFAGMQQFDYTVQDQSGNQSPATVTLNVEQVNDAPVVTLETAAILEDTSITFNTPDLILNATDAEDDWMRIVGARTRFGEINFNEFTGEITYTPTQHFNSFLYGGPAGVDYLVQDERGAETWAPIDIDVAPVNDPPQAFDDTVFAWSSGPGNYGNPIQQTWLLANDLEVDGETIWITNVSDSPNGAVSLNVTATNDGLITYTADSGFVGTDRFNYTVFDGVVEGGINSEDVGMVTVNVLENHAPLTQDFATITSEDTILNFRMSDIAPHVYDEDFANLALPEIHHIAAVNNATNGSVVLNADGSVSFIPTQDYNSVQHAVNHGPLAGFEYTIEDIVGNQSTSTAYITYTPVNDNPVAVTDQIANGVIKEETAAVIRIADILANDYDVDEDAVQFDGLVGASHGSVYVSGDNIVYRGSQDYYGSETITYNVTDGNGGTGTGRITFNVQNVNDIPYVQHDTGTGDDSGPNRYPISTLLGNDSDADGDSLTISRIVSASGGAAGISGGNLVFNASGPGSATIRYIVSDGHGGEAESQLSLSIMHINQNPYNVHIANTQYAGGVINLIVRADDPDHDQSLLRYTFGDATSNVLDSRSDGAVQLNYVVNQGQGSNLVTSYDADGVLRVTVTDPEGGLVHADVGYTYRIDVYEPENNGGGRYPIVFDLNSDGLNLLGYDQSDAKFDWENDGTLNRTGWISGEGDALLAYDHDGDGVIRLENEISFVEYLEGAQTDLEGLNAFDTNGDGLFSANDDAWDEFGLWVDDGDGQSEDGEFVGLDEMNIGSIALTSDGDLYTQNGNVVYGEAAFTYTDGSQGTLGDVGFEIEETLIAEEEQTTTDETSTIDEEVSEEDVHADSQDIVEEAESVTAVDDYSSTVESDENTTSDEPSAFDLLTDDDIDRAIAIAAQTIAAMPPEVEVVPVSDNPEAVVPASVIAEDDIVA